MELRLPSVEQLRTVYDRDLKEAFPAAELKPLRNIEKSWAEGWYKPLVSWFLHGQSKSVQDNLSMLVGMGAFVVFNYVGQRVIVFRK